MTAAVGTDGRVRTENDALIEAAQAAAVPTILREDDEGRYLVVAVPPGQGIETVDLSEYSQGPRRMKGDAVLHDAASFVAYVTRHKSSATVLYANRATSQVVAVLNDHDEDSTPGWGDHLATLRLALTEEWRHWFGKNGQLQGQTAFAEHVEQGIEEITDPPAATMLELAQHFEAHSRVEYKSHRILQDGRRQLNYSETIDAKAGQAGDIIIPKEFTLGIAPYEGTDPYKVTARLRYRIEGEALKIGYTLVRPHDVLKAAFNDVLEQIKAGTSISPLLGVYGG